MHRLAAVYFFALFAVAAAAQYAAAQNTAEQSSWDNKQPEAIAPFASAAPLPFPEAQSQFGQGSYAGPDPYLPQGYVTESNEFVPSDLQAPPVQVNRKQTSKSSDRSPFSLQGYWMPSQSLRDQNGDWSQSGEILNLAVPLRTSADGKNMWLGTLFFEHISIGTHAVLPDSQLSVPHNLWRLQKGIMNLRELDNGWKTVFGFSLGSASSKPFDSFRDLTVTTFGSLEIPFRGRDAWKFSIFYSPTSQLPYPLPGVAYAWRPNETLDVNIGLPFSIKYRPTESFSLSASYFPLTNVNVLAKQQLSEKWSVYTGYVVVNNTYWLAERIDKSELFYLFDQRANIGVQREITRGWSLDFSGGYVFDRQVFQGRGFSSGRTDQVSINPGAIISLQLAWSM